MIIVNRFANLLLRHGYDDVHVFSINSKFQMCYTLIILLNKLFFVLVIPEFFKHTTVSN